MEVKSMNEQLKKMIDEIRNDINGLKEQMKMQQILNKYYEESINYINERYHEDVKGKFIELRLNIIEKKIANL